MLSQSDVMRAAIEAGAIDDEGETTLTRLETTYFDCGHSVGLQITRKDFRAAAHWPRTTDIADVRAWVDLMVKGER